jgi:hypothetical protein
MDEVAVLRKICHAQLVMLRGLQHTAEQQTRALQNMMCHIGSIQQQQAAMMQAHSAQQLWAWQQWTFQCALYMHCGPGGACWAPQQPQGAVPATTPTATPPGSPAASLGSIMRSSCESCHPHSP